MVKRDEIIKFIYSVIGKGLLEKANKIDETANGVQILGKENVKKVVLGVSLNEKFLQEAIKRGADFCIFHHGLDSRTVKSRFPLSTQKRLRLIFQNDLTIAGFHYGLDSHSQIGNNAVIIKKLGAKIKEPFWKEGWGWTGQFAKSQDIEDLWRKCAKLFQHEVFAIFSGPKRVKTIGVVSGGVKPYGEEIEEMEKAGVELLITGEPSESVPHRMAESGINYFVGGHYATEVFGVKALGEKIKTRFKSKLAVEFIDIPNPI